MGKSFQAQMEWTIPDNQAANHIKRFYPRGEYREEEGEELLTEEEQELDDFVDELEE
ncbi:hypothetical protein PSTG_13690 [Puccinia striiformis f. sp. tritici PST-78]|uniref:Uncharacterized protein n=1 Tax=Puccinia striiformis f. sp. tritici PST-78 TaxID=1165861 RepID=A0A0L0V114_9BASI|nr:hypothetical protein PSTG_13690 [Puccinia striiformis f. sp. tritici PST-78]